MKTDYYAELTDQTLNELENFANWMNTNFGHYPLIIGGWAVWAYSPKLGSRDIDAVFTDTKTMRIALKSFFQAHGWKKITGIHQFAKQIKTKKELRQITIDALVKTDVFSIKKLNIRMPVKWGVENCIKHKLNNAYIYIPEPELLICYKITAQLGRTQQLTQATGIRAAYLESKIWKDLYDTVNLLKNVPANKEKIQKFLTQANLVNHLEQFLDDLNAKPEILEEFQTSTPEIKKLLTGSEDAPVTSNTHSTYKPRY